MSTARKCQTKYIAKSALLYTVVSAGLILSAKMIFAQETSSKTIVISPPLISKTVNPGSKSEGTMKITNKSDQAITFKAVLRDFIVEDTIGTPIIDPQSAKRAKYSASAWVGVIPNSFTVEAGKTQTVSYYIQVPADARPGGRYAAAVYEPVDSIDSTGTGAGVETHVGSLFVFRVSGDVIENATVKQFGASKGMQEYGPITINTQIGNFGDAHIKPVGTVEIKNLFGQVVASQSLEENNIFPEASRDYINSIGQKFMFGPYTAELRAKYGDTMDKTLFATAGFFVFPWKIASIALLAVIAIVLFILWMRKKKKSKVNTDLPAEHSTQAPPAPQA